MTADKMTLLKNKNPLWRSNTITDDPIGKNIIKKFHGTLDTLSPIVIKGIIEKQNLTGQSLIEPFVWSPSIMIGARATECQYEGITHHPDTYTTMQNISELIGPNTNILYGSKKWDNKKYDIMTLSTPDHFKQKRYLKYIRTIFKYAKKYLKPNGTLIIKELYILKGCPEGFVKTETFFRLGTRTRNSTITKNTMNKAVRIGLYTFNGQTELSI